MRRGRELRHRSDGLRVQQHGVEAGDGIEAAARKATLTMPFRATHCQGAGLMHGGAVVSLADTALAMAIKTLLPEGTHFATIDMSLQFHAPVRWGTVKAVATVTERSEKDIQGEVAILTEDGIKAATFQATFRIKKERKDTGEL